MQGLQVSDFTSQKALYTSTLQAGIGQSIGVSPSSIVYVSISQPTDMGGGDGGDSGEGGEERKLQGSSTVQLSYSVKVNSMSQTYETLSHAVEVAVGDGTMQADINHAADLSGAEALQTATLDTNVEIQDKTIPRGESVLLTGTQIAGLIIGIFLCLALIAVVVFFALQTSKAAPAANNAPLQVELAQV